MQAAATAAEKMDAIYRRQRFIYDATRRYYLLGRDRLIGSLKPPLGGAVLEVGCGTGRNLIRAAKRYPDARFYGIDISEAMLKSARTSVARAVCGRALLWGKGTPRPLSRPRFSGGTPSTASIFPIRCR